MSPHVSPFRVRAALVAILASLPGLTLLHGQDRRARDVAVKAGTAWSLDEALAQLALFPNDPYLQYVVLQLARREGQGEATATEVERLIWRSAAPAANDRSNVDLFSLFTGALAVQESLQLDAMRGERGGRPRPGAPPGLDPEKGRREIVSVASLKGPEVKSHPWAAMLGTAKPDVGRLALCVPDDFYLVEFRSPGKMLEALEVSDLWGTHLFNQAARDARGRQTGERLRAQLAIEATPLLRPAYDFAVDEVGLAGSDLFVNEGSDVTLLFRVKQADVFKARMDGFLAKAEKAGARRDAGEYLGVPYAHLATPDRSVSVFSAYPTAELHVRGNSKAAFERVLQAVLGKAPDGKPVRRLGDTDEYRYVRTLMPRGAKEEDALVYLSDPFIRRLMGPAVKLTERRRVLCYNHLRMVGHAALLYRTERSQAPASPDDLDKAKCLPGPLTCPDGGKYTLSADGSSGVCSHHGHANFLTPCLEAPVANVSGAEAGEYMAFLDEYNRYWGTYFDPIALRLQLAPRRYRLETIVLPLIDNSIYTGLAFALGGAPEPLDALPVPKRTVFSAAVRLNRARLVGLLGVEDPQEPSPAPDLRVSARNLTTLAIAAHSYSDAFGRLPAAASRDKNGKALLSWRVHMLPFLEQDELYKQFKLDEPWDGEHNKKLIARMPKIYRAPGAKAGEGKTTYLAPVHESTLFPGGDAVLRLPASIPDGLANTIFLVEAAADRAVDWTKPDDLAYDPKEPRKGLGGRSGDGFLAAFADGSVRLLKKDVGEDTLRALFTRAGNEVVDLGPADKWRADNGTLPEPLREELERLNVKELLAKGLGNQIGLHVYDAEPTFDLNLPQFLGEMVSLSGRRGGTLNEGTLAASFLGAALTAPVYASVPVKDAAVVDRFLDALDPLAAKGARQWSDSRSFGFSFDFYKAPLAKGRPVRVVGVEFGPVKWRLYMARVGNGLYLASKPYILEDLIAADEAKTAADAGPTGHALVRVRAKNWDRLLADYRLSWAEGSRVACLKNLGPLASAGRAVVASGAGEGRSEEALGRAALREADRVQGVHFFCPERGHYLLSADGKACRCSVHGSVSDPRQAAAPSERDATGKLLASLEEVTGTLTLTKEGLRAVVVVERK